VLRDYGLAKTTLKEVRKLLPGNSEVLGALGAVTRREGDWEESVAYLEQALALDPRNTELLDTAAWTFIMLRQFPAALKLYDRALDIIPNDPDLMAVKATIYQAQGNLPEAAKLLAQANAQTSSENAFFQKMVQLRLERNLGEAVRLLRARLTQFHFASEIDKGSVQVWLAFTQRLWGNLWRKSYRRTGAQHAEATLQRSTRQLLSCGSAVFGLCRSRGEGLGSKGSRTRNDAFAGY